MLHHQSKYFSRQTSHIFMTPMSRLSLPNTPSLPQVIEFAARQTSLAPPDTVEPAQSPTPEIITKREPKPLLERKLDLLYVAFFWVHLIATLFIDGQHFYPTAIVPPILTWVKEGPSYFSNAD